MLNILNTKITTYTSQQARQFAGEKDEQQKKGNLKERKERKLKYGHEENWMRTWSIPYNKLLFSLFPPLLKLGFQHLRRRVWSGKRANLARCSQGPTFFARGKQCRCSFFRMAVRNTLPGRKYHACMSILTWSLDTLVTHRWTASSGLNSLLLNY